MFYHFRNFFLKYDDLTIGQIWRGVSWYPQHPSYVVKSVYRNHAVLGYTNDMSAQHVLMRKDFREFKKLHKLVGIT